MSDRSKMFAIQAVASQFIVSSVFFVARLLDGMPLTKALGMFIFAFLLGSLLCALAYVIAVTIFNIVSEYRSERKR